MRDVRRRGRDNDVVRTTGRACPVGRVPASRRASSGFTRPWRASGRRGIGLAASVGAALVLVSCFDDGEAPADRLVFVQQPADAVAGVPIAPAVVVEIQDAAGNAVAAATDQVTLLVGSGSGTLVGTLTRSAVAGVTTFDDIIIETADTYTLRASAPGLQWGTSEGFSITHAEAYQLAFAVQPSDAVEAATIAPVIVVELRDEFGNLVTTAGDDVTLSISGGSGTLGGVLTRAAVAGLATFDDITVDTAGTYTLYATAPGLAPATSAAFNITETPVPTRLAFTVQPSGAVEGTAIAPAIAVQVRDQFGEVMTAAGDSITLSISSGSGTLGGALTRAAAAGVATFDDITIDTPGTYTLDATAPGLAPDTSAAFEITVVPAEPTELTDANFDALTGSGVVLIDFWATWCAPCRTQAPIVEVIAAEYTGRALVGKVDVDDNPVTTARFNIEWIPTLVILKDGVEVWRAVGVQSEAELQAALDWALAL